MRGLQSLLAMGILNSIGRLDQRVARDRAAQVPVAVTAAEQALADQIAKRQTGYTGMSVESVAPEVAALIGNQPAAGVTGAVVEDPRVTAARAQALSSLGYSQAPTGIAMDDVALLQKLRQMEYGGAVTNVPTADRQQLDAALAQAYATQNPALAVQVQRALGGVNQALADNVWARSGMYAGIGAGGVAAIPLVTEAGRGLMDLTAWLGGGQDDQSGARY